MKVIDSFTIHSEYSTEHSPGTVLVINSSGRDRFDVLVGQNIHITTPSGESFLVRVEEVKSHSTNMLSIFFGSTNPVSNPIGSDVELV